MIRISSKLDTSSMKLNAFPGGQRSHWQMAVRPKLDDTKAMSKFVRITRMQYMLETGHRQPSRNSSSLGWPGWPGWPEVIKLQPTAAKIQTFSLVCTFEWRCKAALSWSKGGDQVRRDSLESMHVDWQCSKTSWDDKDVCYTLWSLEGLGKSLETKNSIGWLPQAISPQPSDFGH